MWELGICIPFGVVLGILRTPTDWSQLVATEYRYMQLRLGLVHTFACIPLLPIQPPIASCLLPIACLFPIALLIVSAFLTGSSWPAAATNGLSAYPVSLFVTGSRTKQVYLQLRTLLCQIVWSPASICLAALFLAACPQL